MPNQRTMRRGCFIRVNERLEKERRKGGWVRGVVKGGLRGGRRSGQGGSQRRQEKGVARMQGEARKGCRKKGGGE